MQRFSRLSPFKPFLKEIQRAFPRIRSTSYERGLRAIDEAIAPLSTVHMDRPDAALITSEFLNTARLLRHACRRGLLAVGSDSYEAGAQRRELDIDMFGIIQEYSRLWLARNRPGGLADSIRRLESARLSYGWYPLSNYPC